MASVELLPVTSAGDEETVDAITDLVNITYADAEEGLWLPGVLRTNRDDVRAAIMRQELAVASVAGQVVGTICTKMLDANTGWFGTLAVSAEHSGKGIASELVSFAEQRARQAGATAMQLEVMVPQASHAHTDRLAAWYGALGYRHIGDLQLADVDPASIPYLIAPISVAVLQKALGQPIVNRRDSARST